MPLGVRHLAKGTARAVADERGMLLIEILVSAVTLVGMGLATFSVIDQAGNVSGMNRARSVATAIAQSDQDQMRQLPYQALLNRSEAPRQVLIDGLSYTVTSTHQLIDDSVGTSDCSSTSKSAKYLKLTTSVTAPAAKLNVPVVLETLRAPTLGTSGSGSVAIKLEQGNGNGTVGVPVIAGPSAGATNNLGCAFVDQVPEGTVAVSWSKAGYVNENGLTNVSSTVSVRTDQTSIVTGNYDLAGSAAVSFTNRRIADPSTIVTADRSKWSSTSVVNQGITSVPVGKRRYSVATAANTMTADTLFPFSNDYGFYAGNCDGNNPEAYVDGSGVSARITAGATTNVAIDLPRIAITVRNGGTARTGYAVYAAPNTTAISPNPTSTMSDCTEGIYRSSASAAPAPAVTNSSGKTTIDLPYGIWNVCVDNANAGSPRRYTVRYNNTPTGTPSPLAPNLISGARAIDLDTSTVTSTSSLCA